MARKNARRYFPGLEGIRGIAAVLVIFNHVGVYAGIIGSSLFGVAGVPALGSIFNRLEVVLPIFFTVSGALLFRPYALATLEGTRLPATEPYLWRRALRILPAYWLMTPVALVLLNGSTITGAWPVLRPLLFLQVYQSNAIPSGMEQTWSLPTEVAFYLLLPLFAMLVDHFARRGTSVRQRARRLRVPLVAMIAGGLGYTVYTHLPSVGPYPTQFLWLPEYMGFLAVGMMIAVVSVRAELDPAKTGVYGLVQRWPLASWGVALVMFALACTPLTGPANINYPGISGALSAEVLYLIFCFCLVAPLTLEKGESRFIDSVVANRVSLYLGRISYGIFLWHQIFLDGYYKYSHTRYGTGDFGIVLAVVLAGSIAVATASYYMVEHPAMQLRPRLGRAPAALSTLTVVPSVTPSAVAVGGPRDPDDLAQVVPQSDIPAVVPPADPGGN